jgi:hypothetical protein
MSQSPQHTPAAANRVEIQVPVMPVAQYAQQMGFPVPGSSCDQHRDAGARFIELTTHTDEAFAAHLADTRASKRARVDEDDEEAPNLAEPQAAKPFKVKAVKKKSKKGDSGNKLLKDLREIVARQGHGPMNYSDITKRFTAPINLIELLQMSPSYAKHLRHDSTRVNNKKQPNQQTVGASTIEMSHTKAQVKTDHTTANFYRPLYPELVTVRPADKAFRLCGSILHKVDGVDTNIILETAWTIADQGSEICLITKGLAAMFGLKAYALTAEEKSGIRMGTADGQSCQLTHYITCVFTCEGITRTVQAFIRPGSTFDQFQLLLGLPWLHDVDAHIGIRQGTIEIGDIRRGEKRVKIKGPQFIQSTKHNLILLPLSPAYQPQIQFTNHLMENNPDAPTAVDLNHPSIPHRFGTNASQGQSNAVQQPQVEDSDSSAEYETDSDSDSSDEEDGESGN